MAHRNILALVRALELGQDALDGTQRYEGKDMSG